MVHEFEALLIKPDAVGAWTYITVPFDVEQHFGSKSRVMVKGTFNGIAYKGTLMPHGNGEHYMVVNKSLREAAQVTAGSMASVTMERDAEARTVLVPEDLVQELTANPEAEAIFNQFSYSCQKEYVDWIDTAKKAETRQSRIQKSIEKITAGQKLKS
ncbi:YdeI/OmpD-associated family protein [Paenibacillus prosopidis]|uniref:Bacteriocin resistance YdeI/OmpD-like protein n=1 Tax=Paenibacillus prosopidis TaxID=630520 RepID=A0A368VT60_9BACL|nr:YdeI/OmpD-associated family protein [Paenibacillus prosopidis]RCW44364.1 bacteriocin resistance YdeI/OmpD-like protein [Paenibacillus prosopidis]